ncbi:MAG: hypothetical protein Q9166_006236 [cf. Caloplaca sp. 2 TL-2023]
MQLSLSLFSVIIVSLPLTFATHLIFTLPSSLPPISPSTRAHLTTHNLQLTAPLTLARTFRFTNITTAGTYNLDVFCRDYDFEGAVVVVNEQKDSNGGVLGENMEVYRRNPRTGVRGMRVLADEEGKMELRVKGLRGYYEQRQGFELMGLLKSPMILMALVGLAMVFGMPYLLENMDPEMKKEFEEQQKKSVLGNAAGAGNPLQSFDMAGWMAGQTSGAETLASGREVEEEKGGDRQAQGQGQGKGKGRRRG